MTITELSIKRPTLIVVIFIALALTGVFGYFQLRYELLPKMNIPFATIVTVYPGASPGEVENGVTRKIEDAVSSAEKIANIFSTSYEGLSVVSVEFRRTANIDIALQDGQQSAHFMRGAVVGMLHPAVRDDKSRCLYLPEQHDDPPEYALRAVLYLANHCDGDRPIPVDDIGEALGIPAN